MPTKIDLSKMYLAIAEAGVQFFNAIKSLDQDVRPDDRERTGVQIFLCEPGTRNFVLVPVCKPSDAATFFAIEKAVRSSMLGDYASENSQNEEEFKFSGCVMIETESGQKIQASMSGLKSFEDVGGSMYVLCRILKLSLGDVWGSIRQKGGRLPTAVSNPNHYLCKILTELLK